MLSDFMTRAVLAGVGVAVATGGLGCFVVWRRMAYFGDATAHASILGVAVALGFGISVTWGVLAVALLIAMTMLLLVRRGHTADTTLGVLAHSALALGLVAVTMVPHVRVDLNAFLFGDILTVTRDDLNLIWGGAVVINLLLAWRWQGLVAETLSPDLARAAGLRPDRDSLMLVVLIASVVAVSIKVVGALLITAMLIIPPATARQLARTPEQMAVLSVVIGALAAAGGLVLSLQFDTPMGPTLVCVAAAFFALSLLIPRR